MPRRDGPVIQMELLTVAERLAEPSGCQSNWYRFAGARLVGASVLDVGAGAGDGLEILQAAGATPVLGIDPLPLLPHILAVPIGVVTAAAYDAVLALDVVEHVDDDVTFTANLFRVARRWVFVSTPNWDFFHAQNPYHFREYTGAEFAALIARAEAISGKRIVRTEFYESDAERAIFPVAAVADITRPNMAAWIEVA